MQCFLGLLGPTLHKTFTHTMHTMFAHSPQSIHCCPNTSEIALHKPITGAILAQFTQSFFRRKITICNVILIYLANITQENYLCNVSPQSTSNFTQKNNLNFCLDLSGPKLHKKVTYAMLVHG